MKELFNRETLSTILIALLIGMLLGVFYNTKYSIGLRTYFHEVYTKLHPEVKKDSKTIIIEQVTKNSQNIPQKDIFEKPERENKFFTVIKKIFVKPEQKTETIFDNY